MSSNSPSRNPSDASRRGSRFATGRLLAGRYEILDRIGEGGTAEVFGARDHRLDRIVAVKVLRPQYGQDPDARARFAVEARSAAALAVPNIVPVYDFGAADDGSLFIVMRFIDGPSLRLVLSERGSLPAATAIDVGRQIAHALAAAHEHGLIHRDVKPGNILLDAAGTAHLTDFGTVKALVGAQDLTRTGMIFGTAAYLSPEQATGGVIGPRTDLYALGAVLYEALAGRPPFDGDDPTAVAYQHAHEAPTLLAALVVGLDPELERVVMQCLEKDPDRRPASADDLATTFDTIATRIGTAMPAAATLGALANAAPVLPAAGRAMDAPARPTPSPEGAGETVLISTVAPRPVSPHDATVPWSTTVASVPSWSASAPPINTGVAPPARRAGGADAQRRGGTAAGVLLVVLALGVVAVGTVLALSTLRDSGDGGVIADASPTSRIGRTPLASGPAIVPTPTFTPEPVPSTPPTATPTGPPTEAPTTPPTTPTAPPEPTPRPTVQPPTAPPPTAPPPTDPPPTAPPPGPQDVTVEIPDELFVGDYPRSRYHGRSASWVYGQGTPYHTMTARFPLTDSGQAQGTATLQIVGLDGENQIKNQMSISLNGATIYEGPNPLPDDECCGPSGPGNWGSAVFEFPAELLQADNSLVISNLEPADCTTCPKYVMVDFATLDYRAQP